MTFCERLDDWTLAGEEGRISGVGAAVFGFGRSGTTIEDLDAEPVADVLDLPGAAGLGDVVRPRVITVSRRELPTEGRLVGVLLIGVVTVARRELPNAGRVADLTTFDEPADERPVDVLALGVLLLMGVTTVARLEVDEGADELVLPVLATVTERFTLLVVLGVVVGRGAETLGAGLDATLGAIADMLAFGGAVGRGAETLGAGLGAGADLVALGGAVGRGAETLGAGLGAGADLVVLGGAVGRGAETLGAGLGAGADLVVLGGAVGRGAETLGVDLGAGADLAGGADRLFGADLEAEAGADDRAGADMAERPEEDDLPLGGLGSPNAGPQIMIAVRSTANSVFSACLINIFLSPFPGRSFGFWKKPRGSRPGRPN